MEAWRRAAPPARPVPAAGVVVAACLRVGALGELVGGPRPIEEIGQNSANLRDGNDHCLFFSQRCSRTSVGTATSYEQPNLRVGGNLQQVSLFSLVEQVAKPSGPTVVLISDDPSVRNQSAVLLNHVRSELPTRLEHHVFRNVALVAP